MAKSMTKSQIADHLAGRRELRRKRPSNFWTISPPLPIAKRRTRSWFPASEAGACQSEGAHGPESADR